MKGKETFTHPKQDFTQYYLFYKKKSASFLDRCNVLEVLSILYETSNNSTINVTIMLNYKI